MNDNRFVIAITKQRIPMSAGNKALNLQWLLKNKYKVPVSFVCVWSAYQQFLENKTDFLPVLKSELEKVIIPQKKYAIRSSANIEDNCKLSFAGQFQSVLNVSGVEDILNAMIVVWESTSSPVVDAYLEQCQKQRSELAMAVIIQEMIDSKASGVALSCNPVNGTNEIIIEAVQGMGDALVQGGVTPSRWVNKWGAWLNKPEDEVIPLDIASQIVSQTKQIAQVQRSQVDLEWAWDGKKIFWLQVRPITALHHRNVYSNIMSKEMLPGMIKPLIWSINIPMKSAIFVRFMNQMLGDTGIDPTEMIKSFYYRVYFNMGVIGQAFKRMGLPEESVEMMSGVMPMEGKIMRPNLRMLLHLPRMMVFAHKMWKFHHTLQNILPDLEKRIRSIKWQSASMLDRKGLLEATRQLHELVEEITYYNILCPILTVMHTRMLSRQLNRLGIDITQMDFPEGQPGITEYNPDLHLGRLHKSFEQLDPQVKARIRSAGYASLQKSDGNLGEFGRDVDTFLDRFGHLSENGNDFSVPPWRENPDMVLEMIMNCHPRREDKQDRLQFAGIKASPMRRPMLKIFFDRVCQYRVLRERLGSHYTFTYGLFRYYYLAMAEHLVKQGLIDTSVDVFYLPVETVHHLLLGGDSDINLRAEIIRHKAVMEMFKEVSLPNVIYGDEEPPVVDESSERLYGLATSLGHYTGPARVVHGLADYNKVREGDVLVIPYSDVGWTPLFAHVKAVVAESGGLLSHSSIIAREYGIPAVVSVNGAMKLIDDTLITVDGHKGEVVIHPLI